ncbi:NUDIX domain-containing protein [Nocardia nova SH22a]|uniref:NUDIX domain-containing protein n=1 Tax=Nocardia nova SH22a TaxID=1415166 RepID=W5TRH4_9NOCA|nr:NUDIX hydrolase [Nocardia nova]AHH21965.1 NUDIX domain-containing protein [Nocardia nova SH22a]
MRGDGDGFLVSPDGTRQWGRFGAAGLLLRAPRAGGGAVVLMQHRAPWSHQGGTWALPGGARDSHESSVHAAVREAQEEAGIAPDAVRVRGSRITSTAESGWTYTTVVADVPETLRTVANKESAELAWVPEEEVDDRPLHPGFAAAWPDLRASAARLDLGGIAEAEAIAALLPRTVDLAERGFLWLDAIVGAAVFTDLGGSADGAAGALSDAGERTARREPAASGPGDSGAPGSSVGVDGVARSARPRAAGSEVPTVRIIQDINRSAPSSEDLVLTLDQLLN